MAIQFDNENRVYIVFSSNIDLEEFLEKHPTFTFKSIACFNGYDNALRMED